jgi:alpha-mannosidase
LDRGRVPEGTQVKTRWEGADGSTIDALARTPLDAAVPETFLKLAVKLGESMDSDHVATICLAHWPGHVSPWYQDLRRVARYTSALGKFVDVEKYFQTTESPGHHDRFTADRYRAPHLALAVERRQTDPLSTTMRYWRRRTAWEAVQAMHLLACAISGDGTPLSSELPDEIDALAESDDTGGAALDRRLDDALQRAQRRLVDCLPRRKEASEPGYLVLNPSARVRRIGLDLPRLNRLPTVERPVYAAAHTNESKVVVADVPAMGFAWIGPGASKTPREKRQAPVMAEECLLRNDLFEVLINPTTGGLQSIHEYRARGNRMSQQLAYRFGSSEKGRRSDSEDSDEPSEYSTMAADSVETTIATEALGEIVARGRLLDGRDATLATFRQTYRLWRGSRVLLIDVELEPIQEPRHEAWSSYYAARFAWGDETASLWRGVHQARQAAESKRFEAPHYIEIESTPELPAVVERFRGTPPTRRTIILTGGLPYHRRSDDRMLDTLLIVRGERQRKFRLGVGIDLTHPIHDAMQLLAPDTLAFERAPPATGDSGWLLHIDAKNVVATSWEPLFEQGSITGFRARLLETAGRPARFALSCFRDLGSARQLDFQGQPLAECQVTEGKVQLEMSAGEWTEVEARW